MSEDKDRFNALLNNIGSFIEYWGFRKIHGKIWAKIYLSKRPLSTPEIVHELGVSKALVSGALNELLEHKLIEKVGQVKYGGITYIACPNPAEVVLNIVRNRELILFEKIQDDLVYLNDMNSDHLRELNLNTDSIKDLKVLTTHHKKIAQKFCKKKIKSMEDWICFIKKVSRFAL